MTIDNRAAAVAPYPALQALGQVIDRLADLPDVPAARLSELRAKLAAQTFNRVVAQGTRQGETAAASVAVRTAAIAAALAVLDEAATRLTTLLEDTPGAAALAERLAP